MLQASPTRSLHLSIAWLESLIFLTRYRPLFTPNIPLHITYNSVLFPSFSSCQPRSNTCPHHQVLHRAYRHTPGNPYNPCPHSRRRSHILSSHGWFPSFPPLSSRSFLLKINPRVLR